MQRILYITTIILTYLLAFSHAADGRYVQDFYGSTTQDILKCLQGLGADYLRITLCAQGQISPNFLKAYTNATTLGFKDTTAVWSMSPTLPGQNPAIIPVLQLAGYLNSLGLTLPTLWASFSEVDSWFGNITQNQQYVLDLVQAATDNNLTIGFLGRPEEWTLLFGDNFTDAGVGQLALSYVSDDVTKTFVDWQAFGPWQNPTEKTISDDMQDCETISNVLWHP